MSQARPTSEAAGANAKPQDLDVPAMAAMYESGAALREVAEAHGASIGHVRTQLIKHGTKMRRPGPAPRTRTTAHAPTVVDMYENGVAVADIARACGVTQGVVTDILRKRDVPGMAAMYENGATIAETAAAFGVTIGVAYNRLSKHGVMMRH